MTKKGPFLHSQTVSDEEQVSTTDSEEETCSMGVGREQLSSVRRAHVVQQFVQRERLLVYQNSFRLGPVLLALLAWRNQAKNVQRRRFFDKKIQRSRKMLSHVQYGRFLGVTQRQSGVTGIAHPAGRCNWVVLWF
eukprot:2092300-Amphidinium_carterae.2